MPPAKEILFILVSLLISKGNSNPLVASNLIDELQSDTIDLSSLGVMLYSEPDESVGKAVNDWVPTDIQNPEELGTYVEGDMLIPGLEGRNGLVRKSSRWVNAIVPFTFAPSLSKNCFFFN